MNKLKQLADLGQSVWLDYIRRAYIDSGELAAHVEQGLRGVTSNPTIFAKAITGSADYDEQLRECIKRDLGVEEIYEELALRDIAAAADALLPVYESTAGADGYVSIEVSPVLAADTELTVEAGRRLYRALKRPNVMIKVPATPAGMPAVRTLIAEGINVNVTLIFSLGHYEAAAEAYISGLEDLAAAGGDLSRVSSVASFFVSRLDTVVDRELEARGEAGLADGLADGLAGRLADGLAGRIAVANAKTSYARFRELVASPRWQKLKAAGGRVQRLLWASTGTKNSLYPDTLYVDELIGPDTVNTVPPATLVAFQDHGTAEVTVTANLAAARKQLARLQDLGIDLNEVTAKLQADGVAAFSASFESLLSGIAAKREVLRRGERRLEAFPADLRETADKGLAALEAERVMARIWDRDHTVWKPEPKEISNRLGWLDIAGKMQEAVSELLSFADSVRREGYERVLLLGMGGSSLAPELFSRTFPVRPGFLPVQVLDSTDPQAVLAAGGDDLSRTLLIVSTKSGGTVETLSFFKTFYNRLRDQRDEDEAGRHFVAITDPGSKLADLAREKRFRRTFLNDPNIGGRYSALSYFGLVPAALMGLDLNLLLDRALSAGSNCASCNSPRQGDNLGAQLGVFMAEAALAGRDKLTFLLSPPLASFGDWVEQLIAESTGKEGRGILPVVGEAAGSPEDYGADRIFVVMRLEEDGSLDADAAGLQAAGFPLLRLTLNDVYDLGGQFFTWEMATAVAGWRLGINPFDQPNVESAKILAREMVAEYAASGSLPGDRPLPAEPAVLEEFLAQAKTGDYIALQAYLQPRKETSAALQALRTRLRDRYRLATTVGYGPRFLHSTGQLHKGDGGNGLFIQLTASDRREVMIPEQAGGAESGLGFATLKLAQALGDKQALVRGGRRVIRLQLQGEHPAAVNTLAAAF